MILKLWVLKHYLVNKLELSSYWIPQDHIYYVNTGSVGNKLRHRKIDFETLYPSTKLGGANANLDKIRLKYKV